MGAEDETDALGGQLRGSNNWERESGRERKREIGFRRGSNILNCLHESQIVEDEKEKIFRKIYRIHVWRRALTVLASTA